MSGARWPVEAYNPTEKSVVATVTKASQPKNQQRTAVIYFGSERETYLELVQAADSKEFLQFIQQPLQVQLGVEQHKPNCPNRNRYTGHGRRERYLQGWLGERVRVPICRVRCCGCGAVNTRVTQLHPTLP